MADEDDGRPSRLQVLRAQCEELGVPWDYRNKEATLEKRINDFRTRRVEEMDKMEEARKAEDAMDEEAQLIADGRQPLPPDANDELQARVKQIQAKRIFDDEREPVVNPDDPEPEIPEASPDDEDLMGFRKTPDSAPEPQLAEGFGDPATPIGKAEQQAVIAMVEERSTHKQAEHYMVSGFTIGRANILRRYIESLNATFDS
jgi:hypothetical protein